MLPKHVRYQAALHPGCFHRRRSFPTTLYIILHRRAFVNTFFADSLEFFPSRVLPRISGKNAPLPRPPPERPGAPGGSAKGVSRPLSPLLVLHVREPEFDNEAFIVGQLNSVDQSQQHLSAGRLVYKPLCQLPSHSSVLALMF